MPEQLELALKNWDWEIFWNLLERKSLISWLEQDDQVTFPGPKTGDMRFVLGSQVFPLDVSPSWFMPKLWPISCAITYTDSKLLPSLMVQLYSGWHIPDTQARPITLFCLGLPSYRSKPVSINPWSQWSGWSDVRSQYSGFSLACHWQKDSRYLSIRKDQF